MMQFRQLYLTQIDITETKQIFSCIFHDKSKFSKYGCDPPHNLPKTG